MRRCLPFDLPGHFWKGNIHTHSTISDGVFSPEEVCRMYRQAGYHFIALTEHFLEEYGYPLADTSTWRGEGFTTLYGAELHAEETEIGGKWHILAVGLPLDFTQLDGEKGPELAQRARSTGAFVAAAHPQWYSLTESDIVSLGEIDAVEVFNGVSVDYNDRMDGWQVADVLLGKGHRFNVYAADDFHGFPGWHEFGRGWVWVRSETLEPDALLNALKAGHYYSSTGPEIYDVQFDGTDQVHVRCSPAERVFVSGRGPAAASVGGHGLMDVTVDLSRFDSPYGRITVRDRFGGRAWTNPFWFD